MQPRTIFSFLCTLLVFGLMSVTSFGANITDDDDSDDEVGIAAEEIITKAINQNQLFYLKEGQKKRSANFMEFYYRIPKSIRKADEARFISRLRQLVDQRKIVGKNRRPLALILKGPTKRSRSGIQKTQHTLNKRTPPNNNCAH